MVEEALKRGVLMKGRKEGSCSTPSPTWKYGLVQPDGSLVQDFNFNPKNISARKLGANLWEMNKNVPNFSHFQDDKPKHGITMRNEAAVSTGPHNVRGKSLSSASYCSSMEMAHHRRAITPNSSLSSKGKFEKSSHGLKTSTELLRVLNRIWSLEEKHALDMSLVKKLKNELGQSQSQFQELLLEKKRDEKEVDILRKQVAEYKVARKREKSVEEKLRSNSEKMHQKISQELLEMKKSFSNALRDLERERKARILLEDLCDEFAKGIRDYEQELRFIKQRYCKDQIGKESDDRLLLHISEAWLDERMQMKLNNGQDVPEKQTVLNKLNFEIEAFLRAKQSGHSEKNYSSPSRKTNILEHSMESFHLKEPGSAPWNDGDDSISVGKKKSRTRNTYGRNNTRSPQTGEMVRRSLPEANIRANDVDLHGVRRRDPSLMEGSFDHASMFRGPPSPVKRWTSEVYVEDPEIAAGSSSRRGQSLISSTLMGKLMEARLESQKSRAKTTKGLLQGDER